MNPNPAGTGLALNVDESDNALDLNLARSADYFRVRDADAILDPLGEAISTWRDVAQSLEISRGEQDAPATAFHNR